MVVFLALGARNITGQSFNVDGGLATGLTRPRRRLLRFGRCAGCARNSKCSASLNRVAECSPLPSAWSVPGARDTWPCLPSKGARRQQRSSLHHIRPPAGVMPDAGFILPERRMGLVYAAALGPGGHSRASIAGASKSIASSWRFPTPISAAAAGVPPAA